MIRNSLVLCVVFALLVAPMVFGQDAPAEEPMASFEKMADKALAAYNAQDWQAFYTDFASSMAGIATELAFSTLYTNMYMKEYGAYQSRSLILDRCSIAPDSPVALVVYSGVFANNPKVDISINFIKEGETWKVMQIQFNKAP
jgi:hypothetical protein